MKLLEILQKELKEFPEGMLYAVQDRDGEVKFGKDPQTPVLEDDIWNGVWQKSGYDKNSRLLNLKLKALGLSDDWDSAIVTKDMWENDRMKQIIVNVGGLSVEEKQRVNEALAKIKGVRKMSNINPTAKWFYAPDSSGRNSVSWDWSSRYGQSTHTPQQVLEMAGMAKQGHVHADLMLLYAEDAKTTDKPWELWQFRDIGGVWEDIWNSPTWNAHIEYRRKPKTHIVNGVDIPDLRIVPERGDRYYLADPTDLEFIFEYTSTNDSCDTEWAERGLCYEYTEEGKKAAILHAKAMLGIA